MSPTLGLGYPGWRPPRDGAADRHPSPPAPFSWGVVGLGHTQPSPVPSSSGVGCRIGHSTPNLECRAGITNPSSSGALQSSSGSGETEARRRHGVRRGAEGRCGARVGPYRQHKASHKPINPGSSLPASPHHTTASTCPSVHPCGATPGPSQPGRCRNKKKKNRFWGKQLPGSEAGTEGCS